MFRGVWLGLMASAIAAGSACAQASVADFYRNKSIDVYVGLSAGGLYDINGQNIGGPPPKPLPQYVHRLDGTTLYVENKYTEPLP